MPANWIVTDKGDLVNLDFLSKVLYGGNFAAPQDTVVVLYHGVTPAAALGGSTQKYVYADAATALASYNKLIDTMKALGVVTDLRVFPPTVSGVDPVVTGVTGGDVITLNGTGFTESGVVKVDGTLVSLLYQDGVAITFQSPAHAAGVVDVTYTEGSTVLTLAGALTYA